MAIMQYFSFLEWNIRNILSIDGSSHFMVLRTKGEIFWRDFPIICLDLRDRYWHPSLHGFTLLSINAPADIKSIILQGNNLWSKSLNCIIRSIIMQFNKNTQTYQKRKTLALTLYLKFRCEIVACPSFFSLLGKWVRSFSISSTHHWIEIF